MQGVTSPVVKDVAPVGAGHGGLLASVPAARAPLAIMALKAAGYSEAAIIGEVRERSAALEPLTIILEDRGSPPPATGAPGVRPAKSEGTEHANESIQ